MAHRPAVPGYVVRAVTEADSLQALHDAASRHLDDIGFSHFAFHLARAGEYNDRVLTILTDYPDEWIRRYTDRSYLYNDTVHNHSLHTIRPFAWSSVRGRESPKQAEVIFNEAGEFDIRDGMSVPVRGLNETFSLFSAVADGTEAERREALTLNGGSVALLAIMIHEQAAKLVKAGEIQHPLMHLTAREREVMKWVASGKTTPDIGDILKLSEATVNAHVAAATTKLNATTRTHAAVIAVLQGLIDPV